MVGTLCAACTLAGYPCFHLFFFFGGGGGGVFFSILLLLAYFHYVYIFVIHRTNAFFNFGLMKSIKIDNN